jgi:hypothetical protein
LLPQSIINQLSVSLAAWSQTAHFIADNLGWKATRSDAHRIIRDAWNTFEPRTALAT